MGTKFLPKIHLPGEVPCLAGSISGLLSPSLPSTSHLSCTGCWVSPRRGKTPGRPNQGMVQNTGIAFERANNFKDWEINPFANPNLAKASFQVFAFQKLKENLLCCLAH